MSGSSFTSGEILTASDLNQSLNAANAAATTALNIAQGYAPAVQFMNLQTLTSSVSIPPGNNAVMVGPLSLAPGVTISVPPNSLLKVL